MKAFWNGRTGDYYNMHPIYVDFDPSWTARQAIEDLLWLANYENKSDRVALHIVGAMLEVCFPEFAAANEDFGDSGMRLGHSGDFKLGDTVFYVTVAPTIEDYENCSRNVKAGNRVYMLVSDDMVIGARQIAEFQNEGLVSVESIESFVGQKVDVLAGFSCDGFRVRMRELYETYNRRVLAAGNDGSYLIAIPTNL